MLQCKIDREVPYRWLPIRFRCSVALAKLEMTKRFVNVFCTLLRRELFWPLLACWLVRCAVARVVIPSFISFIRPHHTIQFLWQPVCFFI